MRTWYDEMAEAYFGATANLDFGNLWSDFLALVPPGGRILDAGCGSGRDSLHFLRLGFTVTAFDASPEMVRLASRHTGLPVALRRLQDLDDEGLYDGVWCSAAALHVPPAEILDVLTRLHRALRPGGVCYLSFKYGPGEREAGGRLYLDMDETRLVALLGQLPDVRIAEMWFAWEAGPEKVQWICTHTRSRSSDNPPQDGTR